MEFYEKYKKYIIVSGVLLIFIMSSIVIYYRHYNNKKNKSIKTISLKSESLEKKSTEKEDVVEDKTEEYYVDIKGAVMNPGVYKLTRNSIVNDVINIAGGLSWDADTRCTNLSKKITNEMVIYVYSKQEVEKKKEEEKKEISTICNNITNEAYVDYTDVEQSVSNEETLDTTTNTATTSKININTANIEQLTTLPNIGEAKAQEIISKREELGKFETIEDIKQVNGIGDSTYEKIKDLIIVE